MEKQTRNSRRYILENEEKFQEVLENVTKSVVTLDFTSYCNFMLLFREYEL